MILYSARGLAKHFGPLTLLAGADFTLHAGERVGLIGPNGGGKTTLLRILAGEVEHDGVLHRRRGLAVARLEQEPSFAPGATVRSALSDATAAARERELRRGEVHHALAHAHDDARRRLLRELEVLDARRDADGDDDIEHRVDRVLGGVGFAPGRYDEPVDRLSGGERHRVALARLLLADPDLWILDEPTNHLDLDGIAFLERFLARHPAAALIVSHDRRFLDRATTTTWELEAGILRRYPGSYSTSRRLREERRLAQWREWAAQQKLVEKERAFIAKWSAGTRARQAQSRVKRLARLDPAERPDLPARLAALNLSINRRLGDRVLELRDLDLGYPGAPTLVKKLRLELASGEVLGVVGPNGAGKTTLLRTLLGTVAPHGGDFAWGTTIELGVLEQHETFPDGSRSPMQYLADAGLGRDDRDRRDKLGAMLFSGEIAERPVDRLSGGERKRLMLTRLLLSGHNVLLLDEPTNHLDVRGAEAVTMALSAYPGMVLAISHDRYFLDEVADRILWLSPSGWRLTAGDFTFAEAAARESAAAASSSSSSSSSSSPLPSRDGAKAKPAAAGRSRLSGWKLDKLEARIIALEEKRDELHGLFADPAVARDGERCRELSDELAALESELSELEEEYARRA